MSSTIESIFPSPTESILEGDAGAGEEDVCSGVDNSDTHLSLRIASIFIILVGSSIGAFFPIIARRSRFKNRIPREVFDFAKFFGSGVIIATAFIHLLDPAIEALSSPCLTGTWQEYPWALALCMFAIFLLFFAELIAFRWGTVKLKQLGITYDAHGHGVGASHAAHGPEVGLPEVGPSDNVVSDGASASTTEKKGANAPGILPYVAVDDPLKEQALPQIVGIFILEFGVVLHSVLIGLTLAVNEDFKVLFVVIVFHQMFEGLGLGSRLAYLSLPRKFNYVAYAGAGLYAITTPIGIAAGLGVRTTYNPESGTASAVQGIMDALSAGVLTYTGLVELLAHEFLFSSEMRDSSNSRLTYACVCMLCGAGLMALLGRWA